MYKKIYLEITNICNLSCPFCIQNKRERKIMSEEMFQNILEKLKGHTKYLYFHLMGEPLLHPHINEFIDHASNDFFINITTNGYLISKIKNQRKIRQINISLQSFDEKYGLSLEEYLSQIFSVIDIIKENTYISLRFWAKNKYNLDMIKIINKHYQTNICLENLDNNTTLVKNIFLSTHESFIWPDLENDYYNETGTCYALKDHIGILVDGTVVPCCLDSKGIIKLGNILENDLNEIERNPRFQNMLKGFQNHQKEELLCKKCNFKIKKTI